MTRRFMRERTSIAPEPSILRLLPAAPGDVSAASRFSARHFARLLFPVSANTFTFLVLLGNKKGWNEWRPPINPGKTNIIQEQWFSAGGWGSFIVVVLILVLAELVCYSLRRIALNTHKSRLK